MQPQRLVGDALCVNNASDGCHNANDSCPALSLPCEKGPFIFRFSGLVGFLAGKVGFENFSGNV
jgi:hypothetical protein